MRKEARIHHGQIGRVMKDDEARVHPHPAVGLV